MLHFLSLEKQVWRETIDFELKETSVQCSLPHGSLKTNQKSSKLSFRPHLWICCSWRHFQQENRETLYENLFRNLMWSETSKRAKRWLLVFDFLLWLILLWSFPVQKRSCFLSRYTSNCANRIFLTVFWRKWWSINWKEKSRVFREKPIKYFLSELEDSKLHRMIEREILY